MSSAVLTTWTGCLDSHKLGHLLSLMAKSHVYGWKAGDFTLGRSLPGGVEEWPSGRCFDGECEIRWWPNDAGDGYRVAVIGALPESGFLPEDDLLTESLTPHEENVAQQDEQCFVCIGEHGRDPDTGAHVWWESRYGKALPYLDSAPPAKKSAGQARSKKSTERGRVHLRVRVFRTEDGRTQHQLLSFHHAEECQAEASHDDSEEAPAAALAPAGPDGPYEATLP